MKTYVKISFGKEEDYNKIMKIVGKYSKGAFLMDITTDKNNNKITFPCSIMKWHECAMEINREIELGMNIKIES